MRAFQLLIRAAAVLLAAPFVPSFDAGAGTTIEALSEGGRTSITEQELWVAQGKLHARLGERPLIDVLQRLQNITDIDFQVDEGLANQVVFGSFEQGVPLDEGVLRLLRWTSHAVAHDESGKIARVMVLGSSTGARPPRRQAASTPARSGARVEASDRGNVVVVGGREEAEDSPEESEELEEPNVNEEEGSGSEQEDSRSSGSPAEEDAERAEAPQAESSDPSDAPEEVDSEEEDGPPARE